MLCLYCFARLQNFTNVKLQRFFLSRNCCFLSEHESDKFKDSFKNIKEHVHNPFLNLNNILQKNDGVKNCELNITQFYTDFVKGVCKGSPYFK